MIHLDEETTSDPIDVEALRRALPLWLDAFRALDITGDGTLDRDGVRRAGLRLTAGHHPHPGAAYRLTNVRQVELEGEQVERTVATDVDLLADGPASVQLRVHDIESTETWVISVEPTTSPSSIAIEATGSFQASIVVDLGRARTGGLPSAEATLVHRYAAAEVEVTIRTDASGPLPRWRWVLRAEGRGRSIVRPIASLAWLVSRRKIRAEVAHGFAEGVREIVDGVDQMLAQHASSADPADGDRRMVDAWVAQLPESLPASSATR